MAQVEAESDEPDAVLSPPSSRARSARWHQVGRLGLLGVVGVASIVLAHKLPFPQPAGGGDPSAQALAKPAESADHETRSDSDGHADPHPHPHPAPAEPQPTGAEHAMAFGDRKLEEDNPAAALKAYQFAKETADKSLRAELAFRCGLCSEALGELDHALNEYQSAGAATHSVSRRALCELGEARVWLALGRDDAAGELLTRLWLTSGRAGRSELVVRQAAYGMAEVLVRRGQSERNLPLWSPTGLLTPVWQNDDYATMLADEPPPPTTQAAVPGVRVLQHGLDQPEGVFLTATLAQQPLNEAFDVLARSAQFVVEWTPAAQQAVLGRSAAIELPMASLASCFDVLAADPGLTWQCRGRMIQVAVEHEVSDERRSNWQKQSAQRLVRHAVQYHPDSQLAAAAYLSLGNLEIMTDDAGESVGHYEQLLRQFPRSRLRTMAWFNLAKAMLILHRRDEALAAFYNVVDSRDSPEALPAAYLYLGRLTLEDKEPRKAVAPLMRSNVLARDDELKRLSCLVLAAAYLLSDNPAAANMALMHDRKLLVGSEHHDEAAFLCAFARFAASGPGAHRARDGEDLLTALAHVAPASFFGDYSRFLMGRAYAELDLPDRAAALFDEALAAPGRGPFHDPMTFAAAERDASLGDVDHAIEKLTELVQHGGDGWPLRARLRLGVVQRDAGDYEAAVSLCRGALEMCSTDTEKSATLRVLGSVYQRAGDHAAAALCFAGTDPATDLTAQAARDRKRQ